MRKIKINDIGLGNIGSVRKIIDKVGASAIVINSPDGLEVGDKVLIPGVGNFKSGMLRIDNSGFKSVFKNSGDNFKIMGICLGMQLLCMSSEEGNVEGMGLVDASVKKFEFPHQLSLKVPHMGWNTLRIPRDNPLIPMDEEERRFYFVHSYKVVPNNPDISIGQCDYGGEFCAAFQQGNVFGVQFHPEKSHRFGMALMKRFWEL